MLPNLGSSSSANRPKRPSKSSIKSAMKKVNVRRCSGYDKSMKGKAWVQITLGGNGAVRSASALPPFRGTPIGSCLEREVRKQKVSPFKDSKVSFKYPFKVK